jgi:hypothetical protein
MLSTRLLAVRLGLEGHEPLYSRKLHIRVLLARTSCETSLTILAFSLGESVVNHFASRCDRS